MKLAISTLSFVLMAGCQTIPELQSTRPTWEDDPTYPCIISMSANPIISALDSKVGDVTGVSNPSIEQLSDASRPSDTEKLAISAWASERKRCVDLGASFRQQWAPQGFAVAYQRGQVDVFLLISQLWKGEMTWGQFNTARVKNGIAIEERLAPITAQQSQDNQADSAQDDRGRRAALALGLMLQQQGAQMQQRAQQNTPPRTMQTRCVRGFNGSVNCTTY